jgi:5'-nucleotidase
MKRSLSLVLFLFAAACATAPRPVEPVHVVVVGTTDVHGWFNGHVETPPGGGQGVVWGGLPVFASYVEALRAQNEDRVIVVDSGDMFQGTLESNLFEGEAVVRSYNIIGYAAAAVGNHEFDFGPLGPAAIARDPGDDSLGALKRNAELAMFPFLSANMVDKTTGRTPNWSKRTTMVRAGTTKIGIIGLSTPDTPNVTMAANVVTLEFTDPIPAVTYAARELRAQGADAVLVIAHMGGRCADVSNPNDPKSCEPEHEAMQFLEKLPRGTIDAFFAGHTHAQMRHYINGTPALQGGAYSREFSTLDLWIDPKAKRVTKTELRPPTMICSFVYEGTEQCDPRNAPKGAKLVPRVYAGATIAPDARVAKAIEPFLEKVAAKRDEKTGIVTSAPFGRSYGAESPLGDLMADALREFSHSDFAFMNSGGVRSDLRAGNLVYADIFSISPFDNFPAVVTMSGAQVVDALRLTSTGARGIMQVSGLKYVVDAAKDADKPLNDRNKLVSVTLQDGSPLDPEKLYTVTMPDFIAAGGDGTQPVMSTLPPGAVKISYLKPIRDVLVDVLRTWPQPLSPKTEGRITLLNSTPPPAK